MGEAIQTEDVDLTGLSQSARLAQIGEEIVKVSKLQSSLSWRPENARRLRELQEDKERILSMPLTKEESAALLRQGKAGEGNNPELTSEERTLIQLANAKNEFVRQSETRNKRR